MLRKIINTILFIPLSFFISFHQSILSENKSFIDEVIEENEDKIFIDHQEIKNIILRNNNELKALKELIDASSFNLSSKIAKRYPSIDLQGNGLPQYVFGENYNNNSGTRKTSQFSANPSLNIRLDLIDPLRGPEIKIAKENFKIAKNNYEIKKKDLILEARTRFHQYQKSSQDIINKKFALDLSITSLENAQAKLDAGIGTKFEVLEAEAQLSRDKQELNERKIEHQINKISLKEILNLKEDFEIEKEQKLLGFWNHKLNKNINNGLEKNLSLKNISLQQSIKDNEAKSFLNSNQPSIYISNSLSSTFTKGDSLAVEIDPSEYGSSYTNTVSLNFSWNIFNGGQNNKSYKSSKAQARGEEYSYYNLKNVLKTNITKAYLNLKLNEEKILSTSKEISSTKESLRLSRLRYDVGISTLKDVLVRQKELSDAKSKNINAIYNYNLNLDELKRLTFLEISNDCVGNDNTIKQTESICNIPI
ncbi:RND transporter [Prochlorococcus marinus str. MU1404]|uniref:TolC family protein n=1 Tax=Prochlorococcus marinus TaxID=1219 RepID=UPI001ADA6DDE|nr:TolC family protein [Prochlorococcus marinus]MBO8229268.1 TolC family protein [Prochlorococcus marinus XMU1404]MBW3072350.1 RND transporter [Prochlorococcus marinus str. MU1404]MCR8544549.1 TolC family protein [Prochlorococcus marinus CUG1432]